MSVLEIICGAMLDICSLAIVLFVALQSEKSDGLSGAIAGGSDNSYGNKGNSNDEKLASLTKVFCIVFFILTLIVNIFVLINNR